MLAQSEQDRLTLPLAGIAMGLTIACKAYFILAIPLVISYSLWKAYRTTKFSRSLCIDYLFCLVLLPFSLALLTYYPWFGRGYTLPEFFRMKLDAVWALQQFKKEEFTSQFMHAGGTPWEWFIKPIILGQQLFSDGERGRYILEINNFPFRMLALPALAVSALSAWRDKHLCEALPAVLFAGCYLLFLLVQRPMFSYSAAVLLPFAYLATGRTIELLVIKAGGERLVYSCIFLILTAWGIYTLPLISGQTILLSLYRPLLAFAYIMGPN
jgi:dolichyl-phosphate-mannose--protein O-mannosyl transferase